VNPSESEDRPAGQRSLVSYSGSKLHGMAARKYSASMDSDLLDDVERAAKDAGTTVSAFLAEAARDRVALLGLTRVVEGWELEHGPITDQELTQARDELNAAVPPESVLATSRRRPRRQA